MGRRKIWIPEYVISSLQWLHFWGCYLNSGYLSVKHNLLYKKTLEFFETLENAFLAAEIDPSQIKRNYDSRLKWTPEYVISSIQWLHFWGCYLNGGYIDDRYNRLYKKAREIFGSWDNALRAAGLDPKQIRINQRWNDEDIIHEIREMKENGESLSAGYVSSHPQFRKVHAAARYRFFWDAYVERAGFSYIEESSFIKSKTRLRLIGIERIDRIKNKFATKEKQE